jgi:ribosomal protein S18 acetylase RimI-like enzyme
MGISSAITRLAGYHKRHGFTATVRRLSLQARRALFSGRMVLFYCDLSASCSSTADIPSSLKVERHRNQGDLSPEHLQQITSFWNPRLAKRNIEERFERRASLWLIKSDGALVGYGWTLQGQTIEPHFFPLGPNDVHLFDFQVFPQYRGRGMNPLLVRYILRELAEECRGRAFIESAEWNHAQLASLWKTPFHRIGRAKKFTIFGRTMVCWKEKQAPEQPRKELSLMGSIR